MSETAQKLRSELPRPSLRSAVGVPFRLQTYRNLLYLALSFPLGMAYYLFVTLGISIGIGFSFVLVGVPLLVAVLAVSVGLTWFERRVTVSLLGVDIRPPDHPFMQREGIVDRSEALVTDLGVWKGIVFLASKLLLGVASFALIMVGPFVAILMLVTPLFYEHTRVGVFLSEPLTVTPDLQFAHELLLVGVDAVVTLSSWRIDTLGEALVMSAFGTVLLVLALNLLNGLAWLAGRYTRYMLGAPEDAEAHPIGSA
ncbi:sensor domain-containing protein [Halorientalis salina]|uniref:sensor domain-containing protein n=1 Tax=Halorientalis salina TaxID=2932266 RepID=UPI0010AD09E1|nr:sensor domain-containing protein [Halorientalis salina]